MKDWQRVENRSGEELSADSFSLIRTVLESSESIRRFDEHRRPCTGTITYSSVDMLMIMLYTEVNKTTYGGAIVKLHDCGGEAMLEKLEMPLVRGIRRCPSKQR